jgi:branched-chain amino acid transport system substrate-binding protein
MRRRHVFGSALVVLLGGLLLVNPPVRAADPVKIGVLAPLTGVYSIVGDRGVKGVELAAAEINAAGGILGRPVEIIARDDETNPEVALRQVRRLMLQDKVAAVIGPLHGGAAIAVSNETKRNQVIQFPFAAVEDLTTVNCQPFLWRITASASQTARGGADLAKRLGFASWATISSDFSYGRSVANYFVEYLKEINPSAAIVTQAWPKLGEEDFGAYINEIIKSQAKGLYVGLFAADLVRFVKQAKAFGLLDRMTVLFDSGGSHEVLKTLGDDAPFGHWASERYNFLASSSDVNRKFVEAFNKKYNLYPDMIAYDGYASLKFFAAAAEKAKSVEPRKVATALAGLRLETPKGVVWLRPEDHQAVQPTIWGKVQKSASYPFPILADFVVVPAERVTLPIERSGQGCR